MARISVRIEGPLKQRLEAEAQGRGVSPSEVVREALEEHLRRRTTRESCLDIARRIGIVGVYKETPRDLSTNPAHMDGFGGG
jgi:Arc/MetJ-type ribon-helix-helix transcriptional regulator